MVLKLGAQKIYTFFSQPLDQVVLALDELVAAKDRVGILTPNSTGLYEAAAVISKQLKSLSTTGIVNKMDRSLFGLISVDLIKRFLSDPSHQEIFNSLSSQIFLVAAATDNLPPELKQVKPYNDDEMNLILEGKLPYYDDILFVYSLRQIITGATTTSYVSKLLNSLPAATKEEDYENAAFFWLDVLIDSLILQLAWAHLTELSGTDRKFLLQNYFYESLVVGVPVKERLLMAYKDIDIKTRDKELESLFKMLDYNYEFIPTTVEAVFGIKVPEVIRQILGAIFEEKIKTFAQEKFIEDFYEGEVGVEAMKNWMRELLSLVIGLHDHTL